ncbi:MAG: AGE family epimerase/isomerase [Bacteroidota bacterium]|nr:AGE family epimerase/isomerase [Bacteroidota bacterium]
MNKTKMILKNKKKHFSIILLFIFILTGCSNPGNQENADVEGSLAADTNIFEGNFWKNQALSEILPFWTKYSLDTIDGAFITHLDRSWNQINGTEKYPSMISRHVFSYSVAYLFTGEEKYLKIASDAVDFLLEHAWDKEYGGWYNCLDKQGNPIDTTKGSFVQFYTNTGLALYYLVTHDKNVLEHIEISNEIAETKRRDSINGGFFNLLNRDLSVKSYEKSFSSEVVPVSSYMLYLYLATRDDKYLHQAERIMMMALNKMKDPETNWILESFDKDWNYEIRTDNLENEINVGHNQEVVWMFYRLYLLTGKKEYLDLTKIITEKIYKWGFGDNGVWYTSVGRTNPSFHNDFSYWWIQAYGNMFDLFRYKLTGDKEYLDHFKKGADFWNQYFIDKKYGDTYVGVFLDGKIKDDKKAGKYKTSYHTMEYCLLTYLYLDLWVNKKPVELYYCIQSPQENEIFYPSPFEDLSVRVEEVTINGENWTNFNRDEAYINLPELEKVKLKVVLK